MTWQVIWSEKLLAQEKIDKKNARKIYDVVLGLVFQIVI